MIVTYGNISVLRERGPTLIRGGDARGDGGHAGTPSGWPGFRSTSDTAGVVAGDGSWLMMPSVVLENTCGGVRGWRRGQRRCWAPNRCYLRCWPPRLTWRRSSFRGVSARPERWDCSANFGFTLAVSSCCLNHRQLTLTPVLAAKMLRPMLKAMARGADGRYAGTGLCSHFAQDAERDLGGDFRCRGRGGHRGCQLSLLRRN